MKGERAWCIWRVEGGQGVVKEENVMKLQMLAKARPCRGLQAIVKCLQFTLHAKDTIDGF